MPLPLPSPHPCRWEANQIELKAKRPEGQSVLLFANEMWKAVSDASKAKYQKMADAVNVRVLGLGLLG